MPTVVLMNLNDLAIDLTVSTIEVQRLIATKRLPATRMGTDGEWRVTVADFESFVKSGVDGLRLPEYDPRNSGWWGHELQNQAYNFENAIRAAGQEQVPSDEQLRADFKAKPSAQSLDYLIRPTGAVGDVLRQPVPVSAFEPKKQVKSRFATWADLFAVNTLRRLARDVIDTREGIVIGRSAFDALYDSPESFKAITDEAYSTASQRRITFSKVIGVSGPEFGLQPVQRTASFLFNLSEILTPAAKSRFVSLTF